MKVPGPEGASTLVYCEGYGYGFLAKEYAHVSVVYFEDGEDSYEIVIVPNEDLRFPAEPGE